MDIGGLDAACGEDMGGEIEDEEEVGYCEEDEECEDDMEEAGKNCAVESTVPFAWLIMA